MATVVGVHGVGHQFGGEHSLLASWLPAMQDGLARAGQTLAAPDLVCAFFGDLFRPSGKAATDPPWDASDVDTVFEAELLERWWREAAKVDSQVSGPAAQTKVGTPQIVQRALDALSNSKFFAGLAENALIGDLKQQRRYLTEPDTRKAVRQRIERVIGEDTRVVVAHSMGSVVAYEALCAHPEWKVTTFVSLGSPLGIANFIFDRLQPPPQNGVGVFPSGIKRWVNIADKGDVAALVKQLSTRFGARIEDRLVANGASAHDATRYLTTSELGDAVARGL